MSVELAPPRPPLTTRRTVADRLREALLAVGGGKAQVVSHAEKAWASVTFAGARHRVTLRFTGTAAIEAGEAFIADLPEHEFAIPGQLVADAAVTAADHRLLPDPELTVECEVLLLEDA
jgi:hypothetical protein